MLPVVLLVDDHPENLTALSAVLAPLAAELDARVVCANGAEEALRHVLREGDAIAVVLLDVQMPGIDGLETARLIRQRARTGHVPVIFVTAHDADAAAVAAGYDVGAADYLFKPLAIPVVMAKVRAFVELFRHREAAATAAAATATATAAREHAEAALRDETTLVDTVQRIGTLLASELELERIVQTVTDEATALTGAQFGAFFYNVEDPAHGGSLVLYTLSGVPREHFARFPHPRATPVFGPTFRGEGVVRSADITAEPHYGQMAPHYGMPAGHLPVRSYLAVPVRSRGGAVLGGLFFGHERAGVFTDRAERLVVGVAGWTAVAMDNARLYAAERQARTAAEAASAQLAAQARELELANQQLQDTAAELELQAEELQATAAELEVRTEEAEHAASALGASEARLRDVLEQAPIAVAVLTGPEHVYTMMSPRYAEYVGRHPVLGRPLREAVPELEAEGVAELIGRVYRTGEPFFARERLVRTDRDGDGTTEEYYFDIGYQPLRDAGGEVYAVASVSLDVTAQVRARRAVEAAREAAERARAEAEAANQAKSEFLSTMSHELRTPLNAIAGYAELLAMGVRGPVTDAQRQDLERLRRANQHMIGLISDVLNFARLEAGQVEYTIEDVPLGPLIADLEALVGPQLAAKAVALDHDGCAPDTPDRPHSVRADAEKVRQVLLNLLTNAVKFTGPGGQVALACENDVATGVVRVHVADTGRGIPADQLTRIFEPFVQVERHRTHESQQGVGLGLSISRDLARRMGGDLTVASTPGVGSTFTLTLPAAPRRAAIAAERAVRAGA